MALSRLYLDFPTAVPPAWNVEVEIVRVIIVFILGAAWWFPVPYLLTRQKITTPTTHDAPVSTSRAGSSLSWRSGWRSAWAS